MIPLIPLALAAGGAYLVRRGYMERPGAMPWAPGQAKGQSAGVVSELSQNAVYMVIASIATTAPFSPADLPAGIKSTMNSLGWDVIDAPKPRTEADRAAFASKTGPSAWVFTARWTKPDKYVTGAVPTWIGQTIVQYLPVR